jgi:glycerol kinase
MSLVLALDQGTTSSRAAVVDAAGRIRGLAQSEFPQSFPAPGQVEHDPGEIWASQLRTAREALRNAGASAADIVALGITNQRETTIVWERATGRPIAPAIVWQDRRTASHCARLRAEGHGERVAALTGLVLDPYFSATKIAWLLDRDPDVRLRAERGELAFGTVDAWLVWNLTRGERHVTDVTNAARTLLFDIRTLDWSDELLALFAIPRALLPEVLPNVGDFGICDPALLGAAIPIRALAGDQHAGLVGQCAFEAGEAKATYGTGAFVMLNAGAARPAPSDGVLTTIGFALDRAHVRYAREGSIFVAGAAVQWLRDGLGIIANASEIEALARSVPDTGGVTFVPAFTGLGAPYWDPDARGAIVGITRGTTRAHLARAALEAMAFQVADALTGLPVSELRVDGGAAANDFTMQLQADLLGTPVMRSTQTEATVLGAASLAGLGTGMWSDLAALSALRREERRFTPSISDDERRTRFGTWHRAVAAARL